MATIRFSKQAEADLRNIFLYTRETWGEKQAFRYVNGLDSCCRMIAANPALGRVSDPQRPGLRRFEQYRHVLFYRHIDDGIRIMRILHERMLPGFKATEEDPS